MANRDDEQPRRRAFTEIEPELLTLEQIAGQITDFATWAATNLPATKS